MNDYFVGIGVAKAATTWLGEYFKFHPEICMSPIKEIHYFDEKYFNHKQQIKYKRIKSLKESVQNLSNDLPKSKLLQLKQLLFLIELYTEPKAYHKYFELLDVGGRICGEITPEYCLLPTEGFAEMKKFLNHPKIILIIRNPVERYWSHIRFHKKFFPNIDYNQYYMDSFQKYKIIAYSSYQQIIFTLLKIFNRNEIHIIFYEHLFNESMKENVIKGLCDFLEVNFVMPKNNKKVNPSISIELSEKLRLIGIHKFKESYQFIINNFENTPQSWVDDFNKIV